jgi:hypothetical protein
MIKIIMVTLRIRFAVFVIWFILYCMPFFEYEVVKIQAVFFLGFLLFESIFIIVFLVVMIRKFKKTIKRCSTQYH